MYKGQLSSIDLIMSVTVFILLIIFVISYWDISNLRFNANLEQKDISLKAIAITDVLVESEGAPTAWNQTSVKVIGLLDKDRSLDVNKLSYLVNLSYNQTKTYLNIENYDFYLRVLDLTGAVVKADNNFVQLGNLTITPDFIVKLRRYALYGSQTVILEFSMWK